MDIASFNGHSDVCEVLQFADQQERQSSKDKPGYVATPVDTSPTGDTATPVDTSPTGDTATPVDTSSTGETATPMDTSPTGETATLVDTSPTGDTATPVDTSPTGETATLVDTSPTGDTATPVDTSLTGDTATATPVDTFPTGDTVTPGGRAHLENLPPEEILLPPPHTLPVDQFEVGLLYTHSIVYSPYFSLCVGDRGVWGVYRVVCEVILCGVCKVSV